MIVGCLLPLAGIAAVCLFKIPINSILLSAVILLCLLSHLFIIGQMWHDRGSESQGVRARVHVEASNESKQSHFLVVRFSETGRTQLSAGALIQALRMQNGPSLEPTSGSV